MALNITHGSVISSDSRGVLEYWNADTLQPATEGSLSFRFKSDTDLYALCKARTSASVLVVSPRGDRFVAVCRDMHIRIFDYCSGKLKLEVHKELSYCIFICVATCNLSEY